MLYLPAGWFHNVTSFASGPGGHAAFNYWCEKEGQGEREGGNGEERGGGGACVRE